MSVGPRDVPSVLLNKVMGLLDCFEVQPLVKPPETLREWTDALISSFICVVLRRCVCRGCWKWGKCPTLTMGNMCRGHWSDFYFPAA